MWEDFNTAVQAIDIAALDRIGLGDLAGEIGRTRAVLDGLEARITAGLRRLGASEASAAETLRQRTGCSTREAKHRTRRAETLQKMPNVADALSSGRLTGEHASALARAAAETSPEAVDRDAGLLVEASSMPADAASSKARDWVRQRQTDDDLERLHQWQRRNRSLLFAAGEGWMIAGIAKFDRVSGVQFQNLVEALADRLYRADGGRDNPNSRTRAQCRHDALLTLVGIEPASLPPLAAIASPNTSGGDEAGPSGSGVGRGVDPGGPGGSGVSRSGSGAGREAGTGLAVPRPAPLAEFASGGPTPSPSGSGASPTGSGAGFAGSGSVSGGRNGRAGSSGSGAGSASSGLGAVSVPGPGPGSGSVSEAARNGRASSNDGSGAGSAGSGASEGWGAVPGIVLGRGPDTSGPYPGAGPGCTCGRGFGPKAQLCVVMDVPYLATNGERGRCEIPGVGAIARSELERLGCDSDIYGLLFDQRGLPLYHGRKTRRVSPQQWRVLLARDKGCVICGAHPSWCQAHHVRYWRLGGPTDIDNLVLLCHAHHRWVHDNNLILQRGPDGWHAPTGLPPPGDLVGRSARSLASSR